MGERLPVVLINGFWRPDLAFPGISGAWAPELPVALEAAGHRVIEARLPLWHGTAGERAAELAEQLHVIGEPLHLIGHSTGGLAARELAFHRDPLVFKGTDFLVKSISTFATPHWGTAFADWLQCERPDSPIKRAGQLFGVNFSDLRDLTFEAAYNRNAKRESEERRLYGKIPFYTYAGKQKAGDLFWPLLFSWKTIAKAPRAINARVFEEGKDAKTVQKPNWAGGANDGFVSVDSAQWVDFPTVVDETLWNFDHLNFTGHWDPAEVELFGQADYDSRWLKNFRDEYQCFAEVVVGRLAEAEA